MHKSFHCSDFSLSLSLSCVIMNCFLRFLFKFLFLNNINEANILHFTYKNKGNSILQFDQISIQFLFQNIIKLNVQGNFNDGNHHHHQVVCEILYDFLKLHMKDFSNKKNIYQWNKIIEVKCDEELRFS
jgi:hypothetical protein